MVNDSGDIALSYKLFKQHKSVNGSLVKVGFNFAETTNASDRVS